MSELLHFHSPADASRINLDDAQEVEYWLTKFKVDECSLRRAVATVGQSVVEVKNLLGGDHGKIESSIQLGLAESQPDRDRVEALAREGRSLSELLVNNVNAMGASGLEHIVGGFLVTVARLETPDLQTLEEYGGQTLDYVIRLNWKDLLKLQNAAVDGPHVLKSPAPGSDLYELSTASVECFAGWCSLLDTMNCHYETRFPMSPSGS